MDIQRTALILVDMQNDFLHNDGAFGRAQLRIPNRRPLIEQLIKVTEAIRSAGGKIISTNFTLVANKDNTPIISKELAAAWPFLTRGDFQMGRWGHQLIDELAPADYAISKIESSAFYLTFLDWLLQQLQIKTLLFGGLVTQGGISSTLKDAQSLGYQTILLTDGCASFDPEEVMHTVHEIGHVCDLINCQIMSDRIRAKG